MISTISMAEPKPEDLQETTELDESLEPYNDEEEEELDRRVKILAKLNTLVKQWVQDVSIAKNMPEEMAEKLGGKIHTIGSYPLAPPLKGVNIDALCVVPRNIERADYFSSFFELLKQQPEVVECRTMEVAFVPAININFGGFEIDLMFARLSRKEVPDNFNIHNDILLKNNPQQNSAFNGSSSTRKVQLNEFNQDMQITDEIMPRKAVSEQNKFFSKYHHFIVLLATSNNADDHLEWSGLIESKFRLLTLSLERNQHVNVAHIYPKRFEWHEHTPKSTNDDVKQFCDLWFIGLEFERSDNVYFVDLTESIQSLTDAVHNHALRINLLKDGMEIEARHVPRRHLSQYLRTSLLKWETNTSSAQNSGTTRASKRRSSEIEQTDTAMNKKARNDSSVPQQETTAEREAIPVQTDAVSEM
ncbi:poly(A) polymerase gamma-like [Sabethes cyaneus]|uniref:poly(A) polymerase gamma-like n=1 Tax=Sabethes cyaneus TaxID=53552 RepID=UPI00237DD7D0|nr:poly(A) polymerase gamma-like [Sabethes cyaneus]